MNRIKNYFRLLAEEREQGILSRLLWPLLVCAEKSYQIGTCFRRWCYKKKIFPRKRLPFPVVSVGNLTWGGTGKTPLVEYLARKVCAYRRTPLILTRGYSHDEAEQLKHHLPRVLLGVGKKRGKVASEMKKKNRIDLAILDDGLQHAALDRDIEIVTINALNPFGNERLIPRGILREPLYVLKKASIVVLTHVNLVSVQALKDLKQKVQELAPQAQIVEAYIEPLFLYRAKNRSRISLNKMQNNRVLTFAAVGTPRSFQLILQRLGMKTIRNFEFLDHHNFTKKELEEMKRVSEAAEVDEIITTEKDFYRSRELVTRVLNPLVLATRLRILSGEDILGDRLFRLLGVKR